jgi:hypothetical protein
MEKYDLHFFTEYYQFYILDASTKAQTDAVDFWNAAADKNKIAIGDGLLGVTVAKYADIKVEVRICETKPLENAAADHIVEAPLLLASGKLEFKDCTSFDTIFETEMENGKYAVRVSSYKLDTVVNDNGDDYYVVEIWKSEDVLVKLLKKWNSAN